MSTPINFEEVLKQYWGYDSFRPLQLKIIESTYNGFDTLALLPTGGGKSICFQVPAMVMEGVCLVVSPLIALMIDQVENLHRCNIKAKVIYSGMSQQEIEDTFNEAIYGTLKFLYLSPERLNTSMFLNKLKQIKVSFIAVDEAHCISQWGYDFRPSYLHIANIRPLLPNAPILALTATATPAVTVDIMNKLGFQKPHLLSKSFNRPNLTYRVLYKTNKLWALRNILLQTKGSGLIYCGTRKTTEEVSAFLHENGFSVDFYHAGLSNEERKVKQELWKNGKTSVIVATNAFGMGIDKPDVRYVIHWDSPSSIEAYFQEAGRAGRDEQKAYAILLYNSKDRQRLSKILRENFPPLETIKNTYQQIASYLQIPYGAGKELSYDFDIFDFAKAKKISTVTIYACIKILSLAEYLDYMNEPQKVSSLRFAVTREMLYRYTLKNSFLEELMRLIMRIYTGVFSDYQKIDETYLAKSILKPESEICEGLKKLRTLGIIDYVPRKIKSQLTFLRERSDNKSLYISPQHYRIRKIRETETVNAILEYAEITNKCRNQILLEYFGQKNSKECGTCDYCLIISKSAAERKVEIISMLREKPLSLEEFLTRIDYMSEEQYLQDLQELKGDKIIEQVNDLLRLTK